eukprot:gnl/MRDRNA2_/MRDRNA2_310334_c0_seq1.p1 gnl/MRDRNA2_/MRDRNA2_310334_c0~~gnl/MRDRNA2_/MRDRNA2_310334_c0_seq1.p1  ORF type:complete len:208 (-),score=24.33 gnl/MRDRNA2_/MRDRNA2_310334_c0_seq1:8-631(-)
MVVHLNVLPVQQLPLSFLFVQWSKGVGAVFDFTGTLRLDLPVRDVSLQGGEINKHVAHLLSPTSVLPFCRHYEVHVKNAERQMTVWHNNNKLSPFSGLKPGVGEVGMVGDLQHVNGQYRFLVQEFYGNWMMGKWLQKPRLQELTFISNSSFKGQGKRKKVCRGLVVGDGPEWADMPPVNIETDNHFVWDWLSFAGLLNIVRYALSRE